MRKRIVALTVIAAALAIALFGVPLSIVVAKYLLDDERTELERAATNAALMLSVELARGGPVTTLPEAEAGTDVALFDGCGRRVLGTGPAVLEHQIDRALAGAIATGDSGGDLVVAVPVADDGTIAGVVRIASSRTEAYTRIGTVWLLMLALGVAAILAAWLVGRLQGARLARPLERLARGAQRLGEGDFSVRARPAGIAEIDAVGVALDSTAKRIGETLARERAFSADASHQLRTPLTGLRFGLEAALDSPAGDLSVPTMAAAIRTAIDTTDRLERIVDDLLELARDTTRTPEPLHLGDLLNEARDEWHGMLAASGRPLRVVVPAGLPPVAASTAAVRQVLTVLLDNAVRHGAGGVTITARDATDALAVDVDDEGAGISEAGELFVRRSGTAGGHGIGLALARSLAEAEGGRLVLTRAAPPRFTLLLPIVTCGVTRPGTLRSGPGQRT